MLTRKQLDLLNYINKHLNKDGIPPSFDEMKEALDLRSKSGIHRLITALEERGFIRRLAHRARAIEIVKLPDSLETNNKVTKISRVSTINPASVAPHFQKTGHANTTCVLFYYQTDILNL